MCSIARGAKSDGDFHGGRASDSTKLIIHPGIEYAPKKGLGSDQSLVPRPADNRFGSAYGSRNVKERPSPSFHFKQLIDASLPHIQPQPRVVSRFYQPIPKCQLQLIMNENRPRTEHSGRTLRRSSLETQNTLTHVRNVPSFLSLAQLNSLGMIEVSEREREEPLSSGKTRRRPNLRPKDSGLAWHDQPRQRRKAGR